jgi:hypothetical protein
MASATSAKMPNTARSGPLTCSKWVIAWAFGSEIAKSGPRSSAIASPAALRERTLLRRSRAS